ncbi:MAG: lysophospholipid acyltransferase family protein [Candidatus Electryonea clarkiae]|nr:lysophospholipid acyltransferase family protein [Candidatus Electryonea clarkiae]MDP8289008.1 lysophospholipid acyltransferase family protein [Candidatus Electryonea clarkiae]
MKDATLLKIIEKTGPGLLALFGKSLRYTVYEEDRFERLKDQGGFILVTFHGRMFMPITFCRGNDITALISQSRDGDLVSKLADVIGYGSIRGSSTRGARKALKEMISTLNEGRIIANMVDGPRGPFEEPKIGALSLARLTGKPILPVIGASYPNWELKSWDHFQLPKPFSRAVMIWGEPFTVPRYARGEELEKYRIELRDSMKKLREKADLLARGQS